MANPQLEDGYVRIANELVEKGFMRLKLSPNEWQILWVVIRKTYGWHKENDPISVGQFVGKTGMKRRHVSRNLKKLVDRNILLKNDKGYINKFGLQKDYEKWVYSPLGKNKSVTQEGDTSETITHSGDRVSPKQVTTKEKRNYTKEIVSKESRQASLDTLNVPLKVREPLLHFLDKVRQGNKTKRVALSRVERIVQELMTVSDEYGEENLITALEKTLLKEDYNWGTRNATGYVKAIAKNIFEQNRQGKVEQQSRAEKEALASDEGSELYRDTIKGFNWDGE